MTYRLLDLLDISLDISFISLFNLLNNWNISEKNKKNVLLQTWSGYKNKSNN